jgi:hypothetical protein
MTASAELKMIFFMGSPPQRGVRLHHSLVRIAALAGQPALAPPRMQKAKTE